uniref:PiggyBac transposable element-derived protein domain-containing protein n=1 Tax=Trichogramma kaykai TaxID=54128 RepID=A0ABD2WNQ5_9HYME
MSRNKFCEIKSKIKFSKPDDKNDADGAWKVLDEMMVRFFGRSRLKQFVPSKPDRYGIKLWGLAAPNGYLFNLDVYCGRNDTSLETAKHNQDETASGGSSWDHTSRDEQKECEQQANQPGQARRSSDHEPIAASAATAAYDVDCYAYVSKSLLFYRPLRLRGLVLEAATRVVRDLDTDTKTHRYGGDSAEIGTQSFLCVFKRDWPDFVRNWEQRIAQIPIFRDSGVRMFYCVRVEETPMKSYCEPLTKAGDVKLAQYRHFIEAIKASPDLRIEVVLDDKLLYQQARAAAANENNDNNMDANNVRALPTEPVARVVMATRKNRQVRRPDWCRAE